MSNNLDPDEKEQEGVCRETSVVDCRTFEGFFFLFSVWELFVCVFYKISHDHYRKVRISTV